MFVVCFPCESLGDYFVFHCNCRKLGLTNPKVVPELERWPEEAVRHRRTWFQVILYLSVHNIRHLLTSINTTLTGKSFVSKLTLIATLANAQKKEFFLNDFFLILIATIVILTTSSSVSR